MGDDAFIMHTPGGGGYGRPRRATLGLPHNRVLAHMTEGILQTDSRSMDAKQLFTYLVNRNTIAAHGDRVR